MRLFATLALATLAIGLAASPAPADLIVLSLEASDTGAAGTFSSNLQIAAGQTYYYEVTEQFEPFGTTTNGHTLTSLVAGTDGINTFSFNIVDNAVSTGINPPIFLFKAGTLQSNFGNGTGASDGKADGNGGLTGIRGAQSPSVFFGASNTTPTVVLTGTFTSPAVVPGGLDTTIGMSWGGASSGFKINGGTSILASNSTETGASPYFSDNSLILTSPAAVPEPTSLILLGTALSIAGLAATRRRSGLRLGSTLRPNSAPWARRHARPAR